MTLIDFDWKLVVWSLMSLLLLVVFIRAVYSLWGREDIYQSTKLFWTIFILLAPLLGFIFYIIFGGRSDIPQPDEESI